MKFISKNVAKLLFSHMNTLNSIFLTYYLKKIGFWNGKKRVKLVENPYGNFLIKKYIETGKPFMIARYGSVEFEAFSTGNNIDELCNNAGFFPKDSTLIPKFYNIYLQASKEVDLLGVWIFKHKGILHFLRKKKLIKNLSNIKYLIDIYILDPYKNDWIYSLSNKRILVVHPFKKSIEYQYSNRKNIDHLPEFKSLEVIKAVQTIAGTKDPRFSNWFEALEYMKKEISARDFDICLIGCGAYGFPLAAHVKQLGKQAIHIGGSLQLLFGIRGRRWDARSDYSFNEFWIYPSKDEIPKNAEKVENACYWQ